MVSGKNGIPLCICEGSYWTARAGPQSRVKDLARVSAVRSAKVPLFSVLVVIGDTFHAGPVQMDASTAWSKARIQSGTTSAA